MLKHAKNTMAINPKTLDFSPFSEFLVGTVARIDGENSIFSRREPARRETGPSPYCGEHCGPKSAKPCKGKPFDLWSELESVLQKGNPG
jgi:hypothetical protein